MTKVEDDIGDIDWDGSLSKKTSLHEGNQDSFTANHSDESEAESDDDEDGNNKSSKVRSRQKEAERKRKEQELRSREVSNSFFYFPIMEFNSFSHFIILASFGRRTTSS